MTMCSMWQIFLHFAVAGNHSLLHIFTIFQCLGSFEHITCVRLEQVNIFTVCKLNCLELLVPIIADSLQDSFQFI